MANEDVKQKKMLVGILGILFGVFGVHKFLLGYNKEGIIMLLVSLLTCGFGASIMSIIGIIEGIIYLTTPDDVFAERYIQNKKTWF